MLEDRMLDGTFASGPLAETLLDGTLLDDAQE